MVDPFEDDWRELGFYCNHDTAGRRYHLVGSCSGLMRFAELLRIYVSDPRNEMQSEHEHCGPYGLEVMTWPKAGMDDHSIHGPLPKLAELATVVERKLATAKPGDSIVIRDEFSEEGDFSLLLDVREAGFDPALGSE